MSADVRMEPSVREDSCREVDPDARCLYCGSTRLRLLHSGVKDRLGFVPGERAWYRCEECGSAVLVPMPKVEELAAFYPPVYSFTLELGRQSRLKRLLAWMEYQFFFRPMYVSEARTVARHADGSSHGRRLLDIGAGRGLRLLEFRRLGFDVHALDLQEDTCRYLREELHIPAVCADVSEAEDHYEPESFDVITSFYLIEHIPDVEAFLQSCFRLLKPGATLALAMPLVDSLQSRLFRSRWINLSEVPRHLSLPSQQGMAHALSEAGFEQIQMVPDTLLNCAGTFASSAVSGATITHAYSGTGWRAFLPRFVGAGAMIAALPFCLFENQMVDRMSLGIILAQRPR